MKLMKMIGKCILFIPVLSVLMLAPAFADTLSVNEYLVASTNAYETSPTLGNDGISDLVVYTTRDVLPTGFFDAGNIWYQRLAGGAPLGLPVQVTVGPTNTHLNDVSGDYIVYTAYDSVTSISGPLTVTVNSGEAGSTRLLTSSVSAPRLATVIVLSSDPHGKTVPRSRGWPLRIGSPSEVTCTSGREICSRCTPSA